MSGLGLMIAFVIAIIVMIVAISKYKIHPFLSIMTVSLVLGLVAGIPLVDTKVDGKTVQGHRYRFRLFRHVYQYRYRNYFGRFNRRYS